MPALAPEFGQTARFELEEIGRYDERGPAWYWNNFHTGEHTGTHFDAPTHWITGQHKADVATVPVSAFVCPAVVIDVVDRVAEDPELPHRGRAPRCLRRRARGFPTVGGCSVAPDGRRG